mmetsp:Transcript_76940/g.213791  ORF Transcript_76940/g.213791 Transcript_76940/m.213791 type:complete len:324 (+) Transcript_76940:786-1757(+)
MANGFLELADALQVVLFSRGRRQTCLRARHVRLRPLQPRSLYAILSVGNGGAARQTVPVAVGFPDRLLEAPVAGDILRRLVVGAVDDHVVGAEFPQRRQETPPLALAALFGDLHLDAAFLHEALKLLGSFQDARELSSGSLTLREEPPPFHGVVAGHVARDGIAGHLGDAGVCNIGGSGSRASSVGIVARLGTASPCGRCIESSVSRGGGQTTTRLRDVCAKDKQLLVSHSGRLLVLVATPPRAERQRPLFAQMGADLVELAELVPRRTDPLLEILDLTLPQVPVVAQGEPSVGANSNGANCHGAFGPWPLLEARRGLSAERR